MSIEQNISEITPLSAFTSPNRPAETDNLVENELPKLTQELGLLIPQINSTQTGINQSEANAKAYQDTSKIYRDESLTNKNITLQYKTSTELSYSNTVALLGTLVIPTESTYNKDYIEDMKRRDFLNFKIGA